MYSRDCNFFTENDLIPCNLALDNSIFTFKGNTDEHDVLSAKLEHCDIHGITNEWFQFCLFGQKTIFGQKTSKDSGLIRL